MLLHKLSQSIAVNLSPVDCEVDSRTGSIQLFGRRMQNVHAALIVEDLIGDLNHAVGCFAAKEFVEFVGKKTLPVWACGIGMLVDGKQLEVVFVQFDKR